MLSIKPPTTFKPLFPLADLIYAAIAKRVTIPGSIFQSQTMLLESVCMASAHDCTTSSMSDAPGSRRAGCPMPPGLPFPVWGAQPWLTAFSPWWPVASTSDTSQLQKGPRCIASEQQATRTMYILTDTRSLLCLPSWCNVSESLRSGEAGVQQRASGLVLGPGPKHCLIEFRGGQNRTTRPWLQRLHVPSDKQTCVQTGYKP